MKKIILTFLFVIMLLSSTAASIVAAPIFAEDNQRFIYISDIMGSAVFEGQTLSGNAISLGGVFPVNSIYYSFAVISNMDSSLGCDFDFTITRKIENLGLLIQSGIQVFAAPAQGISVGLYKEWSASQNVKFYLGAGPYLLIAPFSYQTLQFGIFGDIQGRVKLGDRFYLVGDCSYNSLFKETDYSITAGISF